MNLDTALPRKTEEVYVITNGENSDDNKIPLQTDGINSKSCSRFCDGLTQRTLMVLGENPTR